MCSLIALVVLGQNLIFFAPHHLELMTDLEAVTHKKQPFHHPKIDTMNFPFLL